MRGSLHSSAGSRAEKPRIEFYGILPDFPQGKNVEAPPINGAPYPDLAGLFQESECVFDEARLYAQSLDPLPEGLHAGVPGDAPNELPG